ncbi:DNA (cytosine-5-)-methyltransferase [Nocardioides marmotae]|uniref:DNA (cytosine-5-)-methyltransferase n=1 Tax=Nocardioides marmotae TaxID=2663857 RepID=UPI0012B65A71|nr:DNA (cytosine-5-)-methyltransferase [Nocardioides marmotae]MBC9734363.1 DNA (cytosine-5-)-methyltransferase [Nocardioides marmotae]MTB85463.1 DNA (cytosine-5-)-methyltransferase [Nocardioides marmotae]
MSMKDHFTFSDLFAGVGGFHAALHSLGGRWQFASEIDAEAAAVYDYNWLRPLREAEPDDEARRRYRVSGDIVELTEPVVKVPRSDVLTAGFPCQPFSKSGFQRGMAETRGTLFWNIARILQCEEKRPAVVMLENVRNLAGPRHRETFATIVATLRELGYRTSSRPAVFSPHLLPSASGGRPQARERVFILAHFVGRDRAEHPSAFDDPVVSPAAFANTWSKHDWDLSQHLPLEPEESVEQRYFLESAERKWLDTWDRILHAVARRLHPGERMPGFPIWADDFRSVEDARALIRDAEALGRPLPAWKQGFLLKNAQFYERHADVLDPFRFELDAFPASRRKLEWQAGPHRPLEETVIQLRPSGIRCKLPSYAPALVAINQTSIVGGRRRLTPREAARLQGLPEDFQFRHTLPDGGWAEQRDAASYKQMGNGVNVGVARFVFARYVEQHADEIREHAANVVHAVSRGAASS